MRAGLEGRGLGDLGEAAIRGFFVGFLALSLGDGILERMTIGMCSLLWQSYCREDLRVLRVSSTPRQHGKRCLRPIHLPRRRSSRICGGRFGGFAGTGKHADHCCLFGRENRA